MDFLVLGYAHAHGFGSMSHLFSLVGWQVCNNFVSNLWQEHYTVHSGSMIVFNSPAVSSKLFTTLFWQVIKISLTKCDNCIEVRWTIPHLLLQKVDYSSFVYDKQHFHVEVKWALPHSTFKKLFLHFHNFYSHSHVFSRKINNLHGVKLLSGTFAFYWNF